MNSYFDFLGKINLNFPPHKNKKKRFYYINIAFSNIFLTVINILLVSIYYFVHFIYKFNIFPLLRQNILGKIN